MRHSVETLLIPDLKPSMTLYSPMSVPVFRNVKLRGCRPGCPGCGSLRTLTESDSTNYLDFCGVVEKETDHRISAKELQTVLQSGQPFKLIDVRPKTEFDICSIPESSSELALIFAICAELR